MWSIGGLASRLSLCVAVRVRLMPQSPASSLLSSVSTLYYFHGGDGVNLRQLVVHLVHPIVGEQR
jgi:hypothetical protein